MEDEKIFRKVAVERLSSTENLDQVTRAVPPKNWAALICLFVVVAAAVAWACLGEIAQLAEGKGVLLSGGSGATGSVIAVMTAEEGADVQAGMEAHITLDTADEVTLAGIVVSVSAAEGKMITSGGISVPEDSLPGWKEGSADIVALIQLDTGEAEKLAETISAAEPQAIGNSSGWYCEVQITVKKLKPIRLILPE